MPADSSSWTFRHPARITTDQRVFMESILDVHAECGKVLLVTTKGAVKRGFTERILRYLPDDQVITLDDIAPNPELDALDMAVNRLKKYNVSSLIALGGGSVLDTAKVLSVALACNEPSPMNCLFRQGRRINWNNKLRLTAIPTTSGSGAEATPFAAVWDKTSGKKYSLSHELLYPDHVFLDPELTLSLLCKQTLYPGLDLISHALESLWNRNRTPVSMAFAHQALTLANKSFLPVLNRPESLEHRTNMQNASLLAGMAISQTRTAIAHSISYPITARLGMPHGLACSFTLPAIIDISLDEFRNTEYSEIIRSTANMLNQLNLSREAKQYAGPDDILALAQDMINPERWGNYSGPAQKETINIILSKALNPDKQP